MPIQMYLVQPKNGNDDKARETIAEFIANRQGLILMATGKGSLIVAFDEKYLDAVKAHYLVDFVGGVTLDPHGPGAAMLQRWFARNAALQLAGRGPIPPGAKTNTPMGLPQPETTSWPPGYRPLRWPRPNENKDG